MSDSLEERVRRLEDRVFGRSVDPRTTHAGIESTRRRVQAVIEQAKEYPWPEEEKAHGS